MWPALHMTDAVAPQLLLEIRLSAPRRVLPALVGKDLPRRAVVGDSAGERLHHQRAALVVTHRQAHEVPRVIVEKRGDVHPLVAPQEKREEIALPKLVRLRALEALLLQLGLRLRRLPLLGEPFRLQHTPNRRFRGADAEPALHDIANSTTSGLRVSLLRGHHGITARVVRRRGLRPLAATARRLLEGLSSTGLVLLHPADERRVRDVEFLGDTLRRDLLLHDRLRGLNHHRKRPRRARLPARYVFAPRGRLFWFLLHLSSPFGRLRQADRATSARRFSRHAVARLMVRGALVGRPPPAAKGSRSRGRQQSPGTCRSVGIQDHANSTWR